MLGLFQSYLGAESTQRVGAQHTLNAEYFKRIDALNYTMLHDDGQHADDLEHADVVLTGVSRTSKTPTSIYLANRGVKTANVPLVPNMPVPRQLEELTVPLVVGLYASPERIVQIRQNRLLGLNAHRDDDLYVDRQAVAEEIAFSRKLCAKHNWPMIDVTRRSIEETAAAVMSLLAERRRAMPVPIFRFMRCSGFPPNRWCSPRKARCAARCWKPPAFRSRRARRISMSAPSSRGHRRPGRGRVDSGARKSPHGRRDVGTASSWAATRRWRWASGAFPSRRTGRRARAARRCAAGPMSCIRPSRSVETERLRSAMRRWRGSRCGRFRKRF